ncbi:MAG: nucleotidyltransferase domain-containing protein [Nanoarchaeota archaeon]|nr:nucleotidyltransferase domain-containing protein [Nanoarchaeota archaeon]MBU1027745.1 nucleotidyltransferase domain-containing protein [Nanoarchaeota archaeon]
MKKNSKTQDNEQTIPEMEINNKYSEKKQVVPENTEKIKKDMDKTKKELEKIKNFILKKYPFTQSISILPPQSIPLFIEEEEVPKQTEKYIQLYVVVPEEKLKQIPQIKQEIVKQLDSLQKILKQKIWVQIKTPVDIWEVCLDSKFELSAAIAMSFPLYDKGFLGALRVAEIHKSLVLQKFEKYVVSYVIGGSLVRGEAVKTSDIDVFVVINDTDVKRMPRLELKERLRSIIYQYIEQAEQLAGVKNKLSPQIYLLTDFWESVKDAHPVIFTFIRDGIPLYDRHTFMPWKALLKMGKLKPSPEAIDMFMSMGDQTVKRAKRMLLDIVVQDIFYGISTPSQALLMLYGLPPTNVKETVKEMKRIFVDKEKMLEKKYYDILEEIMIKYYKGYEHEKIKEVSGKEVDRLLKNVESYTKRLKELRGQIEKRAQEKTIEQIYKDVFELLKSIIKVKAQKAVIEEFEKSFVKSGQFTPQDLRILKDIVKARADFKKGKLNAHTVNEARKNASILINNLIEYNQRCELANNKKE